MTILGTDIKLVASETMLDVDEGGGGPTATVIADGDSNAIFSDISELDRAGGDVSVRKVFVTVQTPNVDTYLGSNIILAKPPADPLVSVSLFSTGETFDRRIDAQGRVESYLAAGPEIGGFLLENHIAGQGSVRLFQRPGAALPTVGSTLILLYNEGLSTQREQYVRVTDVSSEEQTFSYSGGSGIVDYKAQVVTCDLSDPLRFDFVGSPPSPLFSRATNASKVRETVVANAARYYGVQPLVDPITIGDVSAKVDSIFTQIVPNAQTEIPLTDMTAAGQKDAVTASASGTITYTTTQPIGGGTALQLGNAVTPETLVITTSGGNLTDFGGQLYSGADVIGTVDYARGVVTLVNGAPTFNGSKDVTFKPAAAPLTLADTMMIYVSQENRAFNYVLTILPAPAPGSLQVSYRSNGRWYDLRDNGSGQLKGSDASFGVGTISYITGTVAITLGALPDADTGILYAWGSKAMNIDRSANVVQAPAIKLQAGQGGLTPGGVTVTWNNGAPRTASDDGAGNMGGDATGTVDYKTGEIVLRMGSLPTSGIEYTITYGFDEPAQDEFLNPPASIFLSEQDITPGSLELRWIVSAPTTAYGNTNYDYNSTVIAKDNGAGVIKLADGTVVGNIDYATGALSNLSTNVTLSVPYVGFGFASYVSRLYGSTPYSSGHAITGGSLTQPTFINQNVNYADRIVTINPTVPMVASYRFGVVEQNDSDTVAVSALTFDLTTKYAEQIVPGSVNFTLGGRTYFDRNGSLYYGLEVTTGAATLGGTLNYGTGEVTLTSWAAEGSSAVTLKSLLTSLNGTPVSAVTFRVPIAPLRPSSLQILATKVAGGAVNVSANNAGEIVGDGILGHVTYDTGVVVVQFGRWVTAAGNEGEPWYNADHIDDLGKIWKPEPVLADTIKYNAVAFTYLPLDADILGLDPVRLPQDGRVPIYRSGGFVVIGHTDETVASVVANGNTIDCGRERLSRVRVIGNDGATINTGYTVDLDAGLVMFTDVTGYSQPVKVEHRIEDMLQVSDVQISGDLGFTRAITHDYPVGAYVSSALVTGDLRARVQTVFDQASFDGITWKDTVDGSSAPASYNNIAGPIVVTNDGAVTERWALKFTSTQGGQVIGEHVGIVAEFSINTPTAPINPATGKPYFTIPTTGWGVGWAIGNTVRFNTIGAVVPVWLIRTVQQGPETETNHSFTLIARGDVDAPAP